DTKEEYTESLEQYIKNTSENNPGITEEELSQKRMDWFISMKCEKSPWGEKGPWTYTQDYEIYVDGEIGFSFKYPNYLFIEKDPNIPNMLIIMPERLKTTDEPFTSISITVEENSNLLTPFEWLKQEAIGSSRAKPFDAVDIMKEYLDDYQIETIDGQQAIFIDGGLWVVVNTPNQKWRISISPLLDERSGASALFRETEIIVNSFSFLEPWAI
ncbi:MAG: hypothetical protein QGG63_02100, partial [Candidatus Pacebacteria bacterium]|nr:hypothetical protein [Candidatus Paceibacterota bacterium]